MDYYQPPIHEPAIVSYHREETCEDGSHWHNPEPEPVHEPEPEPVHEPEPEPSPVPDTPLYEVNPTTNNNNTNSNGNNNTNASSSNSNSNATSNVRSTIDNKVNNDNRFLFQPITISNEARYTSAKGSSLPQSLSLYGNASHSEYGGLNASVGFVYNLGGRARKAIMAEIEQQSLDNLASMCTQFVRDGILVDYTLMPQYEPCKAFTKAEVLPVPVSPPTVDVDLSEKLLEMMKIVEQQKALIEQNKQWRDRIQTEATQVKVNF